jgi:hypothetical protein
LYKIGLIIFFYIDQKRKFNETRKPRTNNTMNPRDDDEIYESGDANDKPPDDFKTYTSNMQKSLDSYKSYNENLKKYYKETKPGEEPKDLIDHSILNAANDNY